MSETTQTRDRQADDDGPTTPDVVSNLVGVGHSYGDRVIFADVTLGVARGESIAIVGPSGGGKTTLVSCMLGLITPTKGTVELAGAPLAGMSRTRRARLRARNVGVVFQHGELVADLTAEENVALPAMLSEHPDGALDRARRLLDDLGVRADTTARDLSGGETQRTALARALVNRPALVIADEPTGSLDTELRTTTADLLFSYVRERHSALVVVTHDPQLAERADRVYRLASGRPTPELLVPHRRRDAPARSTDTRHHERQHHEAAQPGD